MDAANSFRAIIEAAGLRPGEMIADGQLHRCPVDGKPSAKDGAYILHLDSPASGWWQNWRTGEADTWTAKEERSLSPAEHQALQARIEVDRRARQEEEAKRHAKAADKARRILADAPDCITHPYLERKGVKPCPGLKIGADGRLVVPVQGEDGKPLSLQFIAEDGGKLFLSSGRTRGGYFAIKGRTGRLYICEGLATGLSIREATGQAVLCAFNAGNLEAVAAHAHQKYPDRELVLCADNDHATDGNPGLSKATAAALAVGAFLAVPSFKEPEGKSDFNDLHVAEGLEAVRGYLLGVSFPVTPTETTGDTPSHAKSNGNTGSGLGNSFSLRDSGVFFMEMDKDGNPEWHWVCSPLRILARTRNADGNEWGILLEVLDPEGRAHRWAMPSRLMSGNGDGYRSELLALGLRIAPGSKSKQHLDFYLSTAKVEGFARCVERIGWQGNAFVLPDLVYGEQGGELIVPQGIPSENPFRQKGSLEEWRERVGRVCVGNSRLVLAVSTALAAPLLDPLGMESGGLHLVGGSSLGKTTALHVAGSVCGGGPGGFIKQWRATDNGLEGIAVAHCDALLCLDEMSQAGSKAVSEIAYMLANGQGKGRAGKEGQARKVQTWRVLFLSTGEITLADKLAEDGRGRAKAGQTVRVLDIPADAGAGLGLFEDLHDTEGPGQLARLLKEASANYYGTAFRTFLQLLAADRDNLAQRARETMRTFEAANCPEGADGQVRRVCGRFALVAAAGELGAALGVLPWPTGEATRAAATCFRAWIEQRGGTGAAEVTAGLEQVRHFFQAHGASRFEVLGSEETRPVSNRAGYLRRRNGEVEFLVFPEVFKHEVCAGFDVGMICKELKRAGLLLSEGGRHTRNVRTPDGQRKLYVLTSSVLDGNSGNNGNSPEDTGESLFPPANSGVGTLGTEREQAAERSHCSRSRNPEWEQEMGCNIDHVPTVPAVPTQNGASTTILPSATPTGKPCLDRVTT